MQIEITPQFLAEQGFSSTIVERFNAKLDKSGACWLWTAALNNKGYGIISRGFFGKGHILAHQVSWIIHRGDIPEGLFVCHACDVRHCCNPDHLWIGTQKDNIRDMLAKGRGVSIESFSGEKNKRAKLKQSQVDDMRRLYSLGGTSGPKLAKQFGVSKSLVWSILSGHQWRLSFSVTSPTRSA